MKLGDTTGRHLLAIYSDFMLWVICWQGGRLKLLVGAFGEVLTGGRGIIQVERKGARCALLVNLQSYYRIKAAIRPKNSVSSKIMPLHVETMTPFKKSIKVSFSDTSATLSKLPPNSRLCV